MLLYSIFKMIKIRLFICSYYEEPLNDSISFLKSKTFGKILTEMFLAKLINCIIQIVFSQFLFQA
jgi:hypothetical protein